ncbi:hypothetical protein FRC12_021303, partial [Ceratobasidium sp. 428]
MHPLENTPALDTPAHMPSMNSIVGDTSTTSSLIGLVDSVLLDSARQSANTVDGYITHENNSGQAFVSFHPLSSPPPPKHSPLPLPLSTMAPQATPTAEERLQTLLSNQYHRRMHRNRIAWYRDCEPLNTAPKCFKPSMRNDVPLISDWRTYAQVVAFQAKWKAKRFHELHYEINGVVWGWSDPSTDVIVGLVTSQTVETIEFIISNDPFRVPHIFVSHSDGEEHH